MSKSKSDRTSQDSGNTKLSPKEYRSLNFTYNNYTKVEKSEILTWLKSRKNMSYIFQEETGEETGTPHLQGAFKSKSPIRFDTLKKLFPRVRWSNTISWKASIIYCSKTETRTGEIYKSDDIILEEEREPIRDPLAGKELYKYQEEILNLIKERADERVVNWYWSKGGKVGKSALVKHIYMHNIKKTIIANGKGNDVRNLINNHINEEKKELKIVLLDIVRSNEEYVSYEVIEQIKNGLLYSGKYEGGTCLFNSPHLFVFANFEPNKKRLSKDRWNIVRIDPENEDSSSEDSS